MVERCFQSIPRARVRQLLDQGLWVQGKPGEELVHEGTPVTHLEMRRISDGVKTVERLRTTDSIEKAFVEHMEFQYLYQDGEQYVFMQPRTFDQIHVSGDVVGDYAPYLTENMDVQLQMFEGNAISIEIPQRATFEVVETEPVMKGQTASGSFKPAVLSNGVRTMVPTHIVAGTRIAVFPPYDNP